MRAFLHGDKWWTWNETWDETAAAAVRRPDVSPEDAATPARDIGLMEELERLRRENTALKEEARHSAALKTKTLQEASLLRVRSSTRPQLSGGTPSRGPFRRFAGKRSSSHRKGGRIRNQPKN